MLAVDMFQTHWYTLHYQCLDNLCQLRRYIHPHPVSGLSAGPGPERVPLHCNGIGGAPKEDLVVGEPCRKRCSTAGQT